MEQVGGETVGSQYDLVAKECGKPAGKPVTHIKYEYEQSDKRNERWGRMEGVEPHGETILYCVPSRSVRSEGRIERWYTFRLKLRGNAGIL